jgi:uncharacterized membrane protein YfcA
VEYLFYFLMTFGLATLFSMAGAGAGIAVIPILHFLGFPFDLSKATGLFVGFSTTVTSSLMNWRRGVLQIRRFLPLALTLPLFAPLGAQLSRHVDPHWVKLLFALFLIFSAGMMLFFRKKPRMHLTGWWVMTLLGAGVGTLAGLLGVGGGNLLLPLLILLGFPAKEVAVAVSFVVPFSSLSSFLSYASFVPLDIPLLLSCAAGAVLGGVAGNTLLHSRLRPEDIRKVIAGILVLLALRLLWSL